MTPACWGSRLADRHQQIQGGQSGERVPHQLALLAQELHVMIHMIGITFDHFAQRPAPALIVHSGPLEGGVGQLPEQLGRQKLIHAKNFTSHRRVKLFRKQVLHEA